MHHELTHEAWCAAGVVGIVGAGRGAIEFVVDRVAERDSRVPGSSCCMKLTGINLRPDGLEPQVPFNESESALRWDTFRLFIKDAS
jgi:hypothetical protein